MAFDPIATYVDSVLFSTAAWICFVALGAVLARIDIREHRLPNSLVMSLAGCTVILLSLAAWNRGEPGRLLSALAAGAVVFLGLLGMAVITPSGIGMGDVKLGFVTGLMLGWLGWPWAFWGTFLGFGIGAVWAMTLVMRGVATRSTAIAFGPFMMLGVLISGVWALI